MTTNDLALSRQARKDIETLWNFHVIDSGHITGDLLLILGSHDTRVAKQAAELYLHEHAAPLLVATGGAGKVTHTEWGRPEAEIYAELLTEAGVPSNSILIEPKAANTGDNFDFSKTLVQDRGILIRSGIIVCKPYMARRAIAVGIKKWPEVKWYTRPPQIELWDYPTEDVPLKRMINLMVGDLQRLRVYAERGFQAPVDIPIDVWSAYERLVDLGFDDYVIT